MEFMLFWECRPGFLSVFSCRISGRVRYSRPSIDSLGPGALVLYTNTVRTKPPTRAREVSSYGW